MTLSFAELTGLIGQYLWPFFRLGALLMVMPILSSQVVAPRIRLLLAMVITVAIAPVLPVVPFVDPLSGDALLIAAQQLAIGISMGLILQIYFAVFTAAGQFISMQMGLGMAVMMDPLNGTQIPVLSQLFQLMSFLMFLGVDGHLVTLSIIADSFFSIPIAPFSVSQLDWVHLPHKVAWLFSSALLMVIPAIISLLIVSFTFGVMNRSAPQFNIFSLGFPLTMLAGLMIILLITLGLPSVFIRLNQEALDLLRMLVL